MSKAEKIISGDKRELARGITLVESTLPKHKQEAQELLADLMKETGKSIRIGISGAPGVGKSTFIEAFGMHLIKESHKVAVLTIDPTSPLSGGSILGDKTRMEKLSQEKNAFIRPSPTSGHLGGVAPNTREAILLCEAAGYNVIIVETVGTGQSEYQVSYMTDFFIFLTIAGAGDELQGVKKGILELVDAVVINKADKENIAAATVTAEQYQNSPGLTQKANSWQPKVLTCSSIEGTGIADIWKIVLDFEQLSKENKSFTKKREQQIELWFDHLTYQLWRESFDDNKKWKSLRSDLKNQVINKKETPLSAAQKLVEKIIKI